MTPELSVVIPARNEAENLPDLAREIRQALGQRLPFEIICVDDGSGDDTVERLLAARAELPMLRIVRHARSCGQSTAVLTGVRYARAPIVATLDGDGQNDPADLPPALEAWRRDSGGPTPLLVIGHRRIRHDGWFRKLSSRVANGLRGRLLRDATPDSGCGLKVFERSVYLRLPYFDHMHRFTPALFIREGGRVQSVPVLHRPRLRGRSNYGLHNRLWVGIVDLFGVRWLIKRAKHPGGIEEVE